MSSVTADCWLLPPCQAKVLTLVAQYNKTYHRPCPSTVVAHALGRDHTTIRSHFAALYRKGWLLTGRSPTSARRDWPG